MPFVAALKWTKDGKPHHHSPSRKLLLGEARQRILEFSFAAQQWRATGYYDSAVFVEGTILHGRLKKRPSTLPDLAGYGAPLEILDDPYV